MLIFIFLFFVVVAVPTRSNSGGSPNATLAELGALGQPIRRINTFTSSLPSFAEGDEKHDNGGGGGAGGGLSDDMLKHLLSSSPNQQQQSQQQQIDHTGLNLDEAMALLADS